MNILEKQKIVNLIFNNKNLSKQDFYQFKVSELTNEDFQEILYDIYIKLEDIT